MLLVFSAAFLSAQESPTRRLTDPITECTALFKHFSREDSISWNGQCLDNMTNGFGTLRGYFQGTEISRYTGIMLHGHMHGFGIYTTPQGQRLEGNFSYGEFLNLGPTYLIRLNKIVVREKDDLHHYVSDHDGRQLFYHILLPEGKTEGVVVLLPGTWETTQHVFSSTKALCEKASDQHLAVIVPSINQRLVLNDSILELMNQMFNDAINRYQLPKEKFAIGGFSMGGLFALRYAEIANQTDSSTAFIPRAVFNCDGPTDLQHLHQSFTAKSLRQPNNNEPQYGLREMNQYIGGTPATHRQGYVDHSAFSYDEADGGNARYLTNVSLRIYADVDPEWWITNRNVDMYDMNALDHTAMIIRLREMGNERAEFINAFGKGFRIEGYRHPHSWSIIDPVEWLKWIRGALRLR